jgi:hypothetical protein
VRLQGENTVVAWLSSRRKTSDGTSRGQLCADASVYVEYTMACAGVDVYNRRKILTRRFADKENDAMHDVIPDLAFKGMAVSVAVCGRCRFNRFAHGQVAICEVRENF